MQRIRLSDGCDIAVRIDDYVLPWDERPAVVMLHGPAESGESFRRRVAYFAAHHRVIRPDLRGYGNSTPKEVSYGYSLGTLAKNVVQVLDALELDRVYRVGAKIGGTLAMHLAANHPDRFIALAAVGAPASLTSFDERAPAWRSQIREHGVNAWVRDTTAALPRIACPSVVITTAGSGLGNVNSVQAWQQTISGSRFEVLPGDSFHVAATHPDDCAGIVRRFFDEHGAQAAS